MGYDKKTLVIASCFLIMLGTAFIYAISYGLQLQLEREIREDSLKPICNGFCISNDWVYNDHILSTKRTGEYLICECRTLSPSWTSFHPSERWYNDGKTERFNLEVKERY